MISYLIGDYEVSPAPDSAAALVAPSANKKVSAFVCCYCNLNYFFHACRLLKCILLTTLMTYYRFFKLIEEYSIYFNPASQLDDHDTLTVDSDVEKVIMQKLSFFT